MSDEGVHDGAAQRKAEGGRTTKRRGTARDRTAATLRQGAIAETSIYIDSLRSGAEGDYGQWLVENYFPAGFYTYKASDQLGTAERIKAKIATFHKTGSRIDGKGRKLTPEEAEALNVELYGPRENLK